MSIDIKRWNPSNWFKHERKEENDKLPVSRVSNIPREASGSYAHSLTQPLVNIHREIDNLFDNIMSGSAFAHLPELFAYKNEQSTPISRTFIKPKLDIKEGKKDYQINVEIPGVEENSINLELSDGTLIISGEKNYEKESKDEKYYSIERSYGSFRRILSLPSDANDKEIDAKFKNGVLTITIPRKAEEKHNKNTRHIEIKKAA